MYKRQDKYDALYNNCCKGFFYYIGNFVSYVIKNPPGDHTAAERKVLSATARRRRRMRFRAIFLTTQETVLLRGNLNNRMLSYMEIPILVCLGRDSL